MAVNMCQTEPARVWEVGVIEERQLSAVLSEFARTLVTDFPIQGILDHLVERIVEVLPVTSAGVTLISPGTRPHYIAASDEDALLYEKLQSSTGEGPCLTAYESGQAVVVPDVTSGDDRFPDFCAAATEAGLAAVFTFPLRHEFGQIGALDLYRDVAGPLDESDTAAAQTLADVTCAYLLNAQARQELHEAADRLRASALRDPLTGLANRALLQQRLQHATLRAERTHAAVAVLFADLDNFKQVNDTYGHMIGDALLVAVAHRLLSLVRPGDTLARISGDEFVILCEDLHDPSDVEVLARRIVDAFTAPFTIDDDEATIQVPITASVGMAFAGGAHEIGSRLIRDADAAMYQAKRQGGARHQVLDLREVKPLDGHLQLHRDHLSDAFARGNLDVSYQPIVRAADGLVTGVEALLRWTHPSRGPIPASTTVSMAEEDGLIVDIGAWVLQRSCQEHLNWLAASGGQPLDLAVNVSAGQLMVQDFPDTVAEVLNSIGMDPSALILEITETLFLDDGGHAVAIVNRLKDLGVRVALDDFGTGYSSLSHLHRFPVDIIKIDQSFVAEIGNANAGDAIIAAVTNLAHSLGLWVTAEGVETKRQHDHLVAIGCEAAQGFHYAKPMTSDELTTAFETKPFGRLHLPAQRSWSDISTHA